MYSLKCLCDVLAGMQQANFDHQWTLARTSLKLALNMWMEPQQSTSHGPVSLATVLLTLTSTSACISYMPMEAWWTTSLIPTPFNIISLIGERPSHRSAFLTPAVQVNGFTIWHCVCMDGREMTELSQKKLFPINRSCLYETPCTSVSVCLPVCPSALLSVCLPVCLSAHSCIHPYPIYIVITRYSNFGLCCVLHNTDDNLYQDQCVVKLWFLLHVQMITCTKINAYSNCGFLCVVHYRW